MVASVGLAGLRAMAVQYNVASQVSARGRGSDRITNMTNSFSTYAHDESNKDESGCDAPIKPYVLYIAPMVTTAFRAYCKILIH